MRRTFFFIVLGFFSACSTPNTMREPAQQAGKSEFYQGTLYLQEGGERRETSLALEILTLESQGKIRIALHQRIKNHVRSGNLELERIGNTDVFFVADPLKSVQGRVRLSGGSEWKWNQWAIGLTDEDGNAVAGALVRDFLTGDYRIKLQATSKAGKIVREAEGMVFFVTEDLYVKALEAWKRTAPGPGE